MTDPNPPLATVDRAAVQMILDEHLSKHLEFEEHFRPGYTNTANPWRIDREGLESALINYIGMVRRGDVPVEGPHG